jgi:hypothetical protein
VESAEDYISRDKIHTPIVGNVTLPVLFFAENLSHASIRVLELQKTTIAKIDGCR